MIFKEKSQYNDREHYIDLPCPAFRPLALNPVIPGIAGTRPAGEMAYNLKNLDAKNFFIN